MADRRVHDSENTTEKKALKLVKTQWNYTARQWCEPVEWDEIYGIEDCARDVMNGHCELYHATDGETDFGCCVLRYDGLECVVVAVGGNFGELRFMMEFLPLLEEIGQIKGCSRVRAHVKRPGLIKTYLENGFVPGELVMLKQIDKR